MKFEWEEIYNNSGNKEHEWFEATYRAKTFGGWLIRHEVAYLQNFDENFEEGCSRRECSMVFIPDCTHVWEIEKD